MHRVERPGARKRGTIEAEGEQKWRTEKEEEEEEVVEAAEVWEGGEATRCTVAGVNFNFLIFPTPRHR